MVLCYMARYFVAKAIMKFSICLIPGVGQAFWSMGHVFVSRGDKSSGKNAMTECESWLKQKVNMFFFPEGTRCVNEGKQLGKFKPGAFVLAKQAGVDILPVTIQNSKDLLYPFGFPCLGFGTIHVTVHDPISTEDKTVDTLMEKSQEAIKSAL
eukprot:TRINITY_DN1355_c0_g1_i1.p1 TRINITY_DN1355_c0_g1~~TRINITY_DN1355_c0_g1_i1.p1  ORF type:complete len:153 (-),score=45.60 TRINITY_DN1355_c0_g1_i1:183-641(-)